jgi:hypothetical protein
VDEWPSYDDDDDDWVDCRVIRHHLLADDSSLGDEQPEITLPADFDWPVEVSSIVATSDRIFVAASIGGLGQGGFMVLYFDPATPGEIKGDPFFVAHPPGSSEKLPDC